MRAVFSVASTTFRESIRNRTILGIVLLAIGFIASALLLAKVALDQRTRVIMDWGLFCVSTFGVMLAILMGVSLVRKEVRRKTLYVVLTRPIQRWHYVVGKYLGLSLTLLVEVGLLSLALIIMLLIEGISPNVLLFKALYLSLIEILMVAALAIFFAAFSSPYLSGFFTFGLFVVGRSLPILLKMVDKITAPAPHVITKGLFFALPNLADYNLASRAVYGLDISWNEVGLLTAYGAGYLVLTLILAAWIFSKRDLT
ncbi:MAG: ABC transporter permease subunit [Deltaproteobacteria bacterium]|nr:ABC transporter permease subunit [Deltaproteobacteria bacterium]MBW1871668.1 ABC transporter permease subunit [Deltaproteobacteria bacterium]